MPKVIKDIKPRILKVAKALFETESYSNIDMRSIAKESKIAVGTLYNHFSNKETLFLNILEQSWKDTIEQLYMIKLSDDSIIEVITLLYDSIRARKGLGIVLMKSNLETNKLMTDIIKKIRIIIALHLENYYKDLNVDVKIIDRKIDTALLITGELSRKYPDEREINIKYIIDLLIGGKHE